MTYDQIVIKFGACITWLEYQGLVSAIPNRWKNILIQQVRKYEQYEHNFEYLLTKPKNRSKIIYSELTFNSLACVGSYNKWCENILNEANFTLEEYMKCFESLYKVTNVTNLRDFQYRLLHKRIPTNRELKQWGIKQSDICNFCTEEDGIQHTLFKCRHIHEIWMQWQKYILEKFGVILVVDFKMILTNNLVGKPKNIINTLALVLKQFIYWCKCQNVKASFQMYVNEIRLHEQYEYNYAKQNNKVGFHQTNGRI